jgi:CheY-like chemotaxis protein
VAILIVEDDASLRDLLATILEDEGYAVRSAANGRDGLDALADEPPELIVLDMQMPVLDGQGFRAVQMAHPDWRHIPVIIVSATRAFLAEDETIGAKAVLEKPFNVDQLLALVRQWIGHLA